MVLRLALNNTNSPVSVGTGAHITDLNFDNNHAGTTFGEREDRTFQERESSAYVDGEAVEQPADTHEKGSESIVTTFTKYL
ncbi:hypothetical protein JR316_0005481 [Psilocybe cubensis]|uniref:Uncharacterized protein n=2 Tax=Psilocybe cubensis TaxID=181762 RepID=A0A8H7XM42_PSICU|nr:hypothetical protein JR316_0005481 [Psilocybe cubensis]KAH9483375.1 hypothetical protein JR316_0005481 [Psilocybe cubensis]